MPLPGEADGGATEATQTAPTAEMVCEAPALIREATQPAPAELVQTEEAQDPTVEFKLRDDVKQLKKYDEFGNEEGELSDSELGNVAEIAKVVEEKRRSRSAGMETVEAYAPWTGGPDLRALDLGNLNFTGVNLKGADLRGSKLVDTKMDYCDMQDVNMEDAVVSEGFEAPEHGEDPKNWIKWHQGQSGKRPKVASLKGARLVGAKLPKSMQGVCLARAEMGKTDTWKADLKGVQMEGAFFR